jgi:hypothetical protein
MPVIEVPYSYSVTYVPPRSRKERTETVSDVTPVQVRECSAADAPVAARAVRSDETKPTEYRWHDGKLWQPVRSVDPKGDLSAIAGAPFGANPFVPRDSVLRENAEIKARDDVPMKEIVKSEKLAGTATAQKRADDLLLIDGVLHEASVGPVLYLVPIERNKRVKLVSSDIYDTREDRAPCFIFRGDERDHAIAVGTALFKHPPSVDCEAVEVLMPGALDMDSSLVSLEQTAAAVFGPLTEKSTIGSLSTPFLEAYSEYDAGARSPAQLEDLLGRVSDNIGKDQAWGQAIAGWVVARRRLENVHAPSPDDLPVPA